MNQGIRRREYNRITDEIRHIDMVIEKTESSASRMRYQPESSYVTTQLEKIRESNILRKEKKKALMERLSALNDGLLDDELRNTVNAQMAEANEKSRVTKQKKKEIAADKAAKSVISKAYYQASREQDRQNRYFKKNMERSYRHFSRACSSIPDYMLRNLSEMPNNKGYFWKSVACYGDLPREVGRPTVLFDRKRGGIMVIHEWTPDEYRIYEKKGKERKVLVSCKARRKRILPPACEEVQRQEREEAKRLANRPRKRSSPRKSFGRNSQKCRSRDTRTRRDKERTPSKSKPRRAKSRWEPGKDRRDKKR